VLPQDLGDFRAINKEKKKRTKRIEEKVCKFFLPILDSIFVSDSDCIFFHCEHSGLSCLQIVFFPRAFSAVFSLVLLMRAKPEWKEV
jgi:hypothetical protein